MQCHTQCVSSPRALNNAAPASSAAGFTVVDTLAMGAAGHAIGVGIVLGLKGIGAM
jgi:photosystem I subunit 10